MMEVLSHSDIEIFMTTGILRVPNVFEQTDALALQSVIWEELDNKFGIRQSDPATWRTPPRSPKKAKTSSINQKVINNKFRGIINDLIGKENWKEPASWGNFLITFPTTTETEWKLTHKIWHWDYELFRLFELKGLLIFSFYSDVPPEGGGTLAISGSHQVLEKFYHQLSAEEKKWKHGEQRKLFYKWHPWFSELTNKNASSADRKKQYMDQVIEVEGVPLQVVELTGKPGDVYFCHPRLIHAGAEINLNNYPRFMRVKFLW